MADCECGEAWTDKRNTYSTGEEFVHALSTLPGLVAQRRSLRRANKARMKTAFKKPKPTPAPAIRY